MLFFPSSEQRTEIDADDSAQGRTGKKACRLDEGFGDERHLDEEVEDQRHQDDNQRCDQAFQKPVALRRVAGKKAEDEKGDDAENEGHGVESADFAVGLAEINQERINAAEYGNNKQEAKVDEDFLFKSFQVLSPLNYIFEYCRLEQKERLQWIGCYY